MMKINIKKYTDFVKSNPKPEANKTYLQMFNENEKGGWWKNESV